MALVVGPIKVLFCGFPQALMGKVLSVPQKQESNEWRRILDDDGGFVHQGPGVTVVLGRPVADFVVSAVAVVDGLVAHGIGSIVLNQLTTIKEDTTLAVQYEGGGKLVAPYIMFLLFFSISQAKMI